MSKRKVTVVRPEHTVELTVTGCELCQRETAPGMLWRKPGSFDSTETSVECHTGSVFPDGNDVREHFTLDVCPECFVEKFIPAVEKALGVKFHRSEG